MKRRAAFYWRVLMAIVIASGMFAVNPAAVSAGNVADAITASLEDKMPAFISFAGVVIDVQQHNEDPDKLFVTLEDAEEARVNFVVTSATFIPEGVELTEGESLTGYYDGSRPMTMIYPPQPDAVAFAPAGGPPFAKLDRFDEGLVSYDGILKLNIGADTSIILQDGEEFQLFGQTAEEALANRALMVFYAVTTRSIPAQTTPDTIVVFYEAAAHPIAVIDEPVTPVIMLPPEGTPVELVVGGSVVETIPLTLVDGNIIMVPLYLVCRELEIGLEWDGETQTATVGGQHSVVIGRDEYAGAVDSIVTLGAPPAIIDDRTHVPLAYFSMVLGLNNAYFLEGQIVIDDLEKME